MTHRNIHLLFAAIGMLALSSLCAAQPATDPYAEAARYTMGQPRTATMAIEVAIRSASVQQMREIEAKLLAILQNPQATADARGWALRQLRQAGSEQSAAVVAPLLADKDLAMPARFALQSIPGAKVDQGLRDAAAKLQGELKAGVIQTIGVRADRQAVPMLSGFLADPDAGVVEAALFALGQIGGADALAAVEKTKVPDTLKQDRLHAMVLCAERMAADGKSAEAFAAFAKISAESDDVRFKTAALRGALLADKTKAGPMLSAAIKGADAKLRLTAIRFACELGGAEGMAAIMADFAALPPDAQAMVLSLANDKAALPLALAAIKSEDEATRIPGIAALGRVGDAAQVPTLIGIAAAAKGEEQAEARKSLRLVRGKDVEGALLSTIQSSPAPAKVEAILALAARNATTALPQLLSSAADADPAVSAAALGAVATMGDASATPPLLKLLASAKADEQRADISKAIIAISLRTTDKQAAAGTVAGALAGASVETRCALLRILSRITSTKSLETLRTAAKDAEAAVADTAIRGLADWPDAAAAADLLAIAGATQNQTHKILALRGLVRLASAANGQSPEQRVKQFEQIMPLATRVEDKRMVIAALANIAHPAAIELVGQCLSEEKLQVEAAAAIIKIATSLQTTNPEASRAGVQKILDTCKSPAARQLAENTLIVVKDLVNIAPQGTASSADGLKGDGQSSGPKAAIDGDPKTYWDETDDQPLYRLVVTFKEPKKIAAISIMGFAHHNFAPKDFEIVCDGKTVKKITNAEYTDNRLMIPLEATAASVELKITGYHGRSPAIRELGIYQRVEKK